jgi:hypothetical protein
MHSRTKGSRNKKGHKYTAIRNGRYIYDEKKTRTSGGGGKADLGTPQKKGLGFNTKDYEKAKKSSKSEGVSKEVAKQSIKNYAHATGKTTYRGAANQTSEKNAHKIKALKKHQDVAKANAGAYRGGGQTNSEKLLAAQRKKQRTIGQKVNANAKKLQRALNRVMSHPFKSIQGAYTKSKAKKTGGGNFTKLLNEARKNYKRKPWKSKKKR